jgi:N,N'-diacetyllegionaminate synthase
MSWVKVIAEIGECFNGDMNLAKKLIGIAKEAGCDIAKFQTLDYEKIAANDPEREWFEKISLNENKIKYLVQCAQEADIQILFTPENPKTAGWLLDAGLTDVKISSKGAIDQEFLQFVNNHFNRVFISTGMCTIDEVQAAVECLYAVKDIYIMHCVSEYPTGPLLETRGLKALNHEDVRLNMMRMLMHLFPQHKVGYSDHTAGILAPVAAVAMGAQVIEKHITLDRHTPVASFYKGENYLGTDHVLSLEPDELREMVKQIREVEKIMGPWKWERSSGEIILRDFLRRRFKGGNPIQH